MQRRLGGTTRCVTDDTRFRDHAANERTMLSWIRTGIALMAVGFAIARFALFLRDAEHAVATTQVAGSVALGGVLVALGLATNLWATVRYRAIRRAIEARAAIDPSPVALYVLGIGSALVAAAMAVVLARALAG